ncbi:hypothetical protein LTR62_004001 [Meristemomyces frigidus]|uniref:Glucosidase 2 subunit beta n=1 Tax=Meristemomyces frigidus TaxID=1508187 RepID=A0AAN7TPH6_9PEZI|nr:hypothetical protein LTR62_004001 [Meristemomyces frigidus]
MKAVVALLCLHCAAIAHAANGESPRPRGVGPEFAKFYKDPSTFTCISNPSTKLPVKHLNDDYCDCPDGSDEPGTAACAHLSHLSPHTPADVSNAEANSTLALPGFYCKNKGHIPTYIPFTNVNDGICDYEVCCDGSEEWEHVGGVRCEDRCQQIGKEWKKVDEARQKSLGNAGRKRKELVNEAKRRRKEVEDRLMTLGTEIEGSELKVKQLENELSEVERREKGKVVKSGEQKVGKMGILVGLAQQRTNELRETLERTKQERDASRTRLQELEVLLTTFKEEYNPNFNDEGVKRAVRAWEDYAARDKGPEPDAAHDRDLDAMVKSDKDNGLDWEQYQDGDDNEADVSYTFVSYLPSFARSWVDQKLRDFRVTLIDSGILADNSRSSGSESKSITDAKNRLEAARKDLETQKKSVDEHDSDLQKNWGPDDVFRSLKGQCISTDSGEYTYELCFLEKTTQKSKKGGGGQTNMGNYDRIEMITVDEEVPADGKGLGTGERWALKYENGQHCWNGPNRATTVVLGCAEVSEIWKIREEEKCIYRLEVGTPAVCVGDGAAVGGPGGSGKDEL